MEVELAVEIEPAVLIEPAVEIELFPYIWQAQFPQQAFVFYLKNNSCLGKKDSHF